MNNFTKMSTIAWLILVISASANYVIPLFPIYQLKLRSPLKKRYHNKKSSQRE